MIVVRITMNVLPEKQIEVMQTLLSMIKPTVEEKGCMNYDIFYDINDKNCFSLMEEWETRDDLELHLKSYRFGALLGTRALLCEPLEIRIYTILQSEGMEAIHAARDN